MYTKEEVVEKMQKIAAEMKAKTDKAEEYNAEIERLKVSVLVDRGRLEELNNLHKMIEDKEKELEKKPTQKRKTVKK